MLGPTLGPDDPLDPQPEGAAMNAITHTIAMKDAQLAVEQQG